MGAKRKSSDLRHWLKEKIEAANGKIDWKKNGYTIFMWSWLSLALLLLAVEGAKYNRELNAYLKKSDAQDKKRMGAETVVDAQGRVSQVLIPKCPKSSVAVKTLSGWSLKGARGFRGSSQVRPSWEEDWIAHSGNNHVTAVAVRFCARFRGGWYNLTWSRAGQ